MEELKVGDTVKYTWYHESLYYTDSKTRGLTGVIKRIRRQSQYTDDLYYLVDFHNEGFLSAYTRRQITLIKTNNEQQTQELVNK